MELNHSDNHAYFTSILDVSINSIQMMKKTRFLEVQGQTPKQSTINEIPEAQPCAFVYKRKDEEVPGASSFSSLPQKKAEPSKSKFKAGFLINQDPRQSRFSHGKLMALEKLSCILTLLIFFLACGKTQIDIAYHNPNQSSAIYLMNSLSLCIFALITVVFLRHLCLFQLEGIQKKVFVHHKSKDSLIISFFKRSERVALLVIEVIIILPHPCSFLTGYTFKLFQTMDEIYLNHSLNDLFSLLLAAKAYIMARSLLTLTYYSSPRASRLCHQNGLEHNLIYIIKCLLHEQALLSIAVFFGILMMICGYCLKISEGVLFLYNPGLQTGFENYSNCFWCIFITMSTIGYGDYYPKTMPGRSIILFTSIIGVFLSSILIVSLSLHLDMQPGQTKSHVVLTRLGEQKTLKTEASSVVAQTIKMHQRMWKNGEEEESQLEKDFQTLKNHIEMSKARTRKIKSLVDNQNVLEEMSRLFYILKDNLKDIYEGQLKLREQIEKIEQIHKIKLSFIREVSEMLSKPETSQSLRTHSQKNLESMSKINTFRKLLV